MDDFRADLNTLLLQTDRLRLEVAPAAGASIVAFEGQFGGRWRPLMRPTPREAVAARNPSPMASFTMLPWTNRITGARFNFAGQAWPLRANTPQGWAIHGDGRHRAWDVIRAGARAATCALDSRRFADYNFPFPLAAEITYALAEDALDMTLDIVNAGDSPMPVGFGFHPYFNRSFGAGEGDEVELRIAVGGVYPPLPGLEARAIPGAGDAGLPGAPMLPAPPDMDFSRPAPIGGRDINHCFGGWDGRAALRYPSAGVQLSFECDPVFGHVVIFTPPGKPFVAVEPVTQAIDGFNLHAAGVPGAGFQVVAPGERAGGRCRIRIE